jgi:hypothetical protein
LIERGKMNEEKAAHLVPEMAKAFPEATIEVPQEQIDSMRIDAKDRHVSACAVCASARVICTINLKDFKLETLSEWNIDAQLLASHGRPVAAYAAPVHPLLQHEVFCR